MFNIIKNCNRLLNNNNLLINNKLINKSLTNNYRYLCNINSIKYIEDGEIMEENIITKKNFSIEKSLDILKDKKISVLGYGSQGRAQSLNLKDNNLDVILGLRKNGNSWEKALEDGWIENTNLFTIEEATSKGNIIKCLLSDFGAIESWRNIEPHLYTNDTLYFSHGFGIVYKSDTKIIPPRDINIIMVAPKCSGNSVRNHFLSKRGFNSSYSIYQNQNNAKDICFSLAFALGNNYIFETTFENEVKSDLLGERCVLMGMIQGAFNAQYKVLRENGHSPLESYNETVEEALNSLYPLINQNGMEYMFRNCSTTAQRGALDYSKIFEDLLKPKIQECYDSVENKSEFKKILQCNADENYPVKLNNELNNLSKEEIWDIQNQLLSMNKNAETEKKKKQKIDFITTQEKYDNSWIKYIS